MTPTAAETGLPPADTPLPEVGEPPVSAPPPAGGEPPVSAPLPADGEPLESARLPADGEPPVSAPPPADGEPPVSAPPPAGRELPVSAPPPVGRELPVSTPPAADREPPESAPLPEAGPAPVLTAWGRIKGWFQQPVVMTSLRVLALVVVIGLSIWLVINRERIEGLAALGYPGIFLVSALLNASLFLPLPTGVVISMMGAVFNPIGVAIAAGSGATLGEISGYLAGFSGQPVMERLDRQQKLESWIKRYGGWAIILLAFIPNPFFDAAGMIAGALKMPLWRFLIYCWIGKCLKMLAFALGGAALIDLIPWL